MYLTRVKIKNLEPGSELDPKDLGISNQELHGLIGQDHVVEVNSNRQAIDKATSQAALMPTPPAAHASAPSSQVSSTSAGGTAAPGPSK